MTLVAKNVHIDTLNNIVNKANNTFITQSNTAQKTKFPIKDVFSKCAVSSGFGHIYRRSP